MKDVGSTKRAFISRLTSDKVVSYTYIADKLLVNLTLWKLILWRVVQSLFQSFGWKSYLMKIDPA